MHVFNSKNICFIYCTYFSYKSSNIFFVVVNLHQNTWKQSSSRGHECLKKYLKNPSYQNISFVSKYFLLFLDSDTTYAKCESGSL